MSARGFYDLNLVANPQLNDGDRMLIASSFKLGYDVVALNTIFDPKPATAGKMWKDNPVQIPTAPNLDQFNRIFNSDKKFNFRPRRILSRITFKISDPGQIPNLLSSNANNYDILAVEPSTPKAFQAACETMDIDIISFDFGVLRNFSLFHTPLMRVAARRGVTFEICYSILFHDRVALQYALAAARRVTQVCTSKNVIFSSSARKAKTLRGPYDVANLGYIFGMTSNVKWPVSLNGRAVILKAECRKSAKGAIQIVSTAPSVQITAQPKSPEKSVKPKSAKKRKAKSTD